MKKILLTCMIFCFTAGLASAQTEKGKKPATIKLLPKFDDKAADAKRKALKEADFANRRKTSATNLHEKIPAALIDPRAN